MTKLESELLAAVDAGRLKDLALDLAAIASPTGHSRAVALVYAQRLRDCGLDTRVHHTFPSSPSVVGRLPGVGGGPTLQFAGHLDTVPIPHAAPAYRDGVLYGRGVADMKGGLAAMAEAARIVRQNGVALKGDMLLTAFGLHEAPGGYGEGLSALIRRGVYGDAAIVCETIGHCLPVAGKGMGIFEFTVRRAGGSIHELSRPTGEPNPIIYAARLVARLEERAAELAARTLPLLGHETIFVGMVQSGDFYNRLPASARIVGTRRHTPDKTFADVRNELGALAAAVQSEDATGRISIELAFQPVRESFQLDPAEPLVALVRQAHVDLCGAELPLVGMATVADAPILIREAGIPAVYYGPWSDRAHADEEYIPLDELVQATKMYILAALRFCGVA